MEEYVQLPGTDYLSAEGAKWLEDVLPGFNFQGFVADITSGGNVFHPDKIFNTVLNIFASELYEAFRLLAVITAIILVCAILGNLKSAFNKECNINTSVVSVALITGLTAQLFSTASTYASNIAEDVTNIMWATLPVIATLTAASGFTVTGIVTHPVLYFMCSIFAEIFNKVLIPLSVSYLALSLTDIIAETIELGKLRELIKRIYNFVLGLIMTFFTGLISISSFAGVSLDSVGAKGAKFALSSMVPFVGRSISDAMGAVVSASMVLKNSVGITAIVCMLALCIIPVIKIAVIILALRISAAFCEPVAEKSSILALSAAGDSLSMINAAVISTVVMMVISLSLIVGIR